MKMTEYIWKSFEKTQKSHLEFTVHLCKYTSSVMCWSESSTSVTYLEGQINGNDCILALYLILTTNDLKFRAAIKGAKIKTSLGVD